jgi:prolipoprotein diacylglyceryltransferase
MVHAWLGKREDYVLFGAAFLALAISLIYAYLEVTNLESLTLPIAAAFLMSGVLAFRIKPSMSSLLWLGPSFAVVLLPSALRANESLTYSTRFSATLVAAIALLILGARLGYAGMVIVGFVTVLILVQHPLASLFQAVHPWISFTVSGLLLLVIGARFEYLRTRAGVAKAWLTDSLR